jgi:hypothetical protein
MKEEQIKTAALSFTGKVKVTGEKLLQVLSRAENSWNPVLR